MKPYLSLFVFLTFTISSIITGTCRYFSAEADIRRDLSSALNYTLAKRGGTILTTDTINTCRRLQRDTAGQVSLLISDDYFNRRLSIPQLRGRAYISMTLLADGGFSTIKNNGSTSATSRTMTTTPCLRSAAGVNVALNGCADCTFLTILSLSDQRVPFSLSCMAALWAAFSLYYMRRRRDADRTVYGGLTLNASMSTLLDASGQAVKLTPMQQQLMGMFLSSPDGRVTKQEICDTLWPRKPDANDTLYTLICRLKPVIERAADITIESERGRAYLLRPIKH